MCETVSASFQCHAGCWPASHQSKARLRAAGSTAGRPGAHTCSEGTHYGGQTHLGKGCRPGCLGKKHMQWATRAAPVAGRAGECNGLHGWQGLELGHLSELLHRWRSVVHIGQPPASPGRLHMANHCGPSERCCRLMCKRSRCGHQTSAAVLPRPITQARERNRTPLPAWRQNCGSSRWNPCSYMQDTERCWRQDEAKGRWPRSLSTEHKTSACWFAARCTGSRQHLQS